MLACSGADCIKSSEACQQFRGGTANFFRLKPANPLSQRSPVSSADRHRLLVRAFGAHKVSILAMRHWSVVYGFGALVHNSTGGLPCQSL